MCTKCFGKCKPCSSVVTRTLKEDLLVDFFVGLSMLPLKLPITLEAWAKETCRLEASVRHSDKRSECWKHVPHPSQSHQCLSVYVVCSPLWCLAKVPGSIIYRFHLLAPLTSYSRSRNIGAGRGGGDEEGGGLHFDFFFFLSFFFEWQSEPQEVRMRWMREVSKSNELEKN